MGNETGFFVGNDNHSCFPLKHNRSRTYRDWPIHITYEYLSQTIESFLKVAVVFA